ncbi:hypothetical protein QE422_001016 [Chryseobacterium sp. SORGH_AS 447]|nr:hypothetical protein [Chryseobacterium sp. SORGH_AS_0447]
MSYINYLKDFDFDILYKTSFILPFIGYNSYLKDFITFTFFYWKI